MLFYWLEQFNSDNFFIGSQATNAQVSFAENPPMQIKEWGGECVTPVLVHGS